MEALGETMPVPASSEEEGGAASLGMEVMEAVSSEEEEEGKRAVREGVGSSALSSRGWLLLLLSVVVSPLPEGAGGCSACAGCWRCWSCSLSGAIQAIRGENYLE